MDNAERHCHLGDGMRLATRIEVMATTHPHADATYRVISFEDGSFGVEVSIPESEPTTVRTFATEADAEAWIAGHQKRVRHQIETGRGFPRKGGPRT